MAETNQSAIYDDEAEHAVPEMPTAAGRGVEATEEQARAIMCTAKRAVEEEAKTKTRADGGAGSAAGEKPSSSSPKRSLECFLEGRRKNKATSSAVTRRRRHLDTSTASSSLSSSSSSSST